MDLPPVGAIAAIRPVNERRPAEDVTPPFAIDGTVSIDDAGNSADANAADCDLGEDNLEEDVLEDLIDEENMRPDAPSDEPPKRVNFFA